MFYRFLALLLVFASSNGLAGSDPRTGAPFRDCRDCPEMVIVPAGSYDMGSAAGETQAKEDEMPQHRVTIGKDFAVGAYEVTRAQFEKFVDATHHDGGNACHGHESGKWQEMPNRNWRQPGFEQAPTHPVVCVNWNDAKQYVHWLSAITDKPYRLLTESEWEYVAKKGSAAYGGLNGMNHNYANYGAEGHCCTPLVTGKDRWLQTAPVGSFIADALGVHDIRGNVWEWLEDCYHDHYMAAPTDGSARTSGCSLADRRAVRGGSWGDSVSFLRPSYRLRSPVEGRYFTLGFRVARNIE